MNNCPIGIFDSGVGGLTVARAIRKKLPEENMIYFGDTAHCPWGDKSVSAIQDYTARICHFLLENHCKIIVIACNTASSLALQTAKEILQNRALLLNVIDPVIEYLQSHHAQHRVGLIGTRQTISSQYYAQKITELNTGIELFAKATPLLVPLIEEGFIHKAAMSLVLQEYLSTPDLLNLQALILGCTHYPLLKKEIEQFYDHHVDIVDSAEMTAIKLEQILTQNQLHATRHTLGKDLFYVSDLSQTFNQIAKRFFPELSKLELCQLQPTSMTHVREA